VKVPEISYKICGMTEVYKGIPEKQKTWSRERGWKNMEGSQTDSPRQTRSYTTPLSFEEMRHFNEKWGRFPWERARRIAHVQGGLATQGDFRLGQAEG
jgi:hypothetical protein